MTHANGKRFLWGLAFFLTTSTLGGLVLGVRAVYLWGTTMTRVHALLAERSIVMAEQLKTNADTIQYIRMRQDSVLNWVRALNEWRCLELTAREKALTGACK